jgi:hypothetical protein
VGGKEIMSEFELSVNKDYIPTWKVQEGLRELFQNAIDQQRQDAENTWSYEYNNTLRTLRISNKKSVLTRDTLLLGSTSKASDKNTIGSFGEGYKLALLVLTREGKKVTVYNRGLKEQWTPRFKVAKRLNNATILVIDMIKQISYKQAPDDLNIVIEGITQEEFDELQKLNLNLGREYQYEENDDGQVLTEEEHAGKIFVSGLYVTTYKKLHYGYNFPPSKLRLNRDRDMVDGFNIEWAASQACRALDSEQIIDAINSDYVDVKYLSLNDYNDRDVEVMEAVVEKVKKQHGTFVKAATNQTEADVMQKAYPKATVIIAAPAAAKVINEAKELQEEKNVGAKDAFIRTSRIREWAISNKDYIPNNSLRELFDMLLEEEMK